MKATLFIILSWLRLSKNMHLIQNEIVLMISKHNYINNQKVLSEDIFVSYRKLFILLFFFTLHFDLKKTNY